MSMQEIIKTHQILGHFYRELSVEEGSMRPFGDLIDTVVFPDRVVKTWEMHTLLHDSDGPGTEINLLGVMTSSGSHVMRVSVLHMDSDQKLFDKPGLYNGEFYIVRVPAKKFRLRLDVPADFIAGEYPRIRIRDTAYE